MSIKRDKRRQGEFYTPKPFVDLAHEYMSDVFGEDWKEKYVVWDPAAGTGNLTRDYRFKELYVSTLLQSDIDTINQMGYNPNATIFQFDFLNDPDEKLPAGLLAALRGERDKEVIVLANPPYGTANNMGTKVGDHKAGIATTQVQQDMKSMGGWGSTTQQLFAQFMFRIWRWESEHGAGIHQALFTKPIWLTGTSYKKFRENFAQEGLQVEKAFLAKADAFAGVSSNWGISFAILKAGRTTEKRDKIPHDLLEEGIGTVGGAGRKVLYNTDLKMPASKWVRKEIRGVKTFDAPQISSYVSVKPKGRGKLTKGALGYLLNNSNNVYSNNTEVALFSGACSKANGLSVIPENLLKSTSLFTARKLIQGNWINDKDEYLAPDDTTQEYKQFASDSLIHSLFNNSSQQSALRQIEYKDKLWDIKNEFFWCTKGELMALAEKHHFDALYQDAKYSNERFMHGHLMTLQLSPLAAQVLEAGTELYVDKCFPFREIMHEEHPEYHLHAWDAGYAQLKLIAQKFLPEEHKAFRDLYREFEAYLRPQVYELGFLLRDGSEVELLR